MSSVDDVVIRDATPSDSRAIAEVHVASWRWAYRDDLPAEFLDGQSVDDAGAAMGRVARSGSAGRRHDGRRDGRRRGRLLQLRAEP